MSEEYHRGIRRWMGNFDRLPKSVRRAISEATYDTLHSPNTYARAVGVVKEPVLVQNVLDADRRHFEQNALVK